MSLPLHDVPALPDPNVTPPVVAESGDPFASLRVVHLLARIDRGVAVRSVVRTPASDSPGE